MTVGPICWVYTIRNAIMIGQFDWIEKWTTDQKTGYDARCGISEYRDYLSGSSNKHMPFKPTEYEIKKFKEYEEDH